MNGTYTVTQRPLTWTIGTVGSVYGNDMAELSNTLTYTGDADKKTIVNGDDLKAVISITKKDVEDAKAEEISMKSADGAASLVAESVPESVKDYGAYDMVGSYDNDRSHRHRAEGYRLRRHHQPRLHRQRCCH